jgi:hypothetical protein
MALARKRVNHSDEVKTASFHDEWLAKLRRPTPLWGLSAVAGLAVVFAAWQWHRSGDGLPKRWIHENISYSACFNNLTFHPSRNKDCFREQKDEETPIPLRRSAWIYPHVAVYSTAAPQHTSPTLRDLHDRGQAEAISFLEKSATPKGGAWDTLQNALDDAKTAVGERDPFRFGRVLVANVAESVYREPGDRMVWTRVLVEPINFEFAGYSVAETDNETLMVTSVERTNSRKFSADLSATIPGMAQPKAEVGSSGERSVKTDTDINAQYEKLGIDILPNFLRIIRESETGGDAVGNTKVFLTAVTDPDMIWRRYPLPPGRHQSDSAHHKPNEDPTVLLVTGTHFPEDGDQSADGNGKAAVDILPGAWVPHCPLLARVWMLYEQRHVDGGRESYDESNQYVTMVHDAEDKQDVEFMSADEVSPAVWSLQLCKDPKCVGDDERYLQATVLSASGRTADVPRWRKVVFTDYGVAIRLAQWLRMNPGKTPPQTDYQFDYPPGNSKETFSFVPKKATGDQCKSEQPEEVSRR